MDYPPGTNLPTRHQNAAVENIFYNVGSGLFKSQVILRISIMRIIKGFFGVQNFRFRDLGRKTWQIVFSGLLLVVIFGSFQNSGHCGALLTPAFKENLI